MESVLSLNPCVQLMRNNLKGQGVEIVESKRSLWGGCPGEQARPQGDKRLSFGESAMCCWVN